MTVISLLGINQYRIFTENKRSNEPLYNCIHVIVFVFTVQY